MNKKGWVTASGSRPYSKQDSRDINLSILMGFLLIALAVTFRVHLALGIANAIIVLFLLNFIIKSQRELIKKRMRDKKSKK